MSVFNDSDLVTNRIQMSGRVTRYACWPTITTQDVGQHCWQIYVIYWKVFGLPNSDVAFVINFHDAEELITGDPPFPVKARNPALKEAYTQVEIKARQQLGYELPDLCTDDKLRVKICDLLEMMTYGMHERELGNILASPVITRTGCMAEDLSKCLPEEDQLKVTEFVKREWDRHALVLSLTNPSIYSYENRRELFYAGK